MGQLERLKEEERGKRAVRKQPNKIFGRIVNWNPNPQELDQLKSGVFGPLEALDLIGTYLEDGHRLSMGFNPDRAGHFAMLREGNVAFEDAVTISVWGGSAEKALTKLGFYLREVNPDFPRNVQLELFRDDW